MLTRDGAIRDFDAVRRSGERDACGVGWVASTTGAAHRKILTQALSALCRVEHRGGCLADGRTGDGAGVMTEIPFALLGIEPKEIAVATLFLMLPPSRQRDALSVFEATFLHRGLRVADYRPVPIDTAVLGRDARRTMPTILHAFIERPAFCRRTESFEQLLHLSKQTLRTQMRKAGFGGRFFSTSLSTRTIIYKALTKSEDLARFYPDLRAPEYATRFALFHRRFSTNTSTSWDKAQPFRMIAHNGEINTIACNRAWSYSREQALGLPKDELLTHEGISDSGNLNEMVEALRYRSSIPRLDEILAIMVPPATHRAAPFYRFWGRALEPWDGPAFLGFSDGALVGARLDKNGFRPCRWAQTKDALYLASEAGVYDLASPDIIAKGTLHGGCGVSVDLLTGEVSFADPSENRHNATASFDPRLEPVGRAEAEPVHPDLSLFGWTREDVDAVLRPMMQTGKEPIGSMGDTARPAIFSDEPRAFFDFFFQTFAQVTNPPLDHLRERMVTDLSTVLGVRPNVFAPKSLLPPAPGVELSSPVLDPQQMAYLKRIAELSENGRSFETQVFHMTFPRVQGPAGLRAALATLEQRVLDAIRGGCSILILSDRRAKEERPPIPSLLALRAADRVLTEWGRRLDVSIVVDTADVRSTHHLACLVGFGAAAVCPYMAFEQASGQEENLRSALEAGLLKIMSKMGISSVRGYQGAGLFTAYGLSQALLDRWFNGMPSPLGGLDLEGIAEAILRRTAGAPLPLTHALREQNKGKFGELHSMTSAMTRVVHQVAADPTEGFERWPDYEAYLALGRASHPVSPRHLLRLKAEGPIPLEDVQPAEEILRTFGSGAMSFGAISADSQRDLIKAMRQVGGRSASGEGGENPYYHQDGTTATTKQVASGRFGVTAEYLVASEEIEIKVAQGAKPGEGGQLMAVKVGAEIARARHSNPGVDLISPPPLHDIYSIEDLRELIYELKQLVDRPVSVKLVAGANIGAIACGVVKAGADTIQISGGDGGTGAASLSSMKHAGLPWELGLVEVHAALMEQNLREHVRLRVDGGLSNGEDVVMAALLGAEEFAFGKLLLVAEGCIMARVCEKNTCPRGIATHDPKYQAKYRGRVQEVVTWLRYLAEDVRRNLARVGASRLDEIVGRADLMEPDPAHAERAERRGVDLSALLAPRPHRRPFLGPLVLEGLSRLNARIAEDADRGVVSGAYGIQSTDRAALARVSGNLARGPTHYMRISLSGSAGQGLGVFLVEGLEVTLRGEANDSVCKSMSGGRMVILPPEDAGFDPARSSIIGNCALYGATGGRLFVYGRAGDRFAVRNSGATAVVEGTGLHACEYMTRGTVVILGEVSANVGAGMTGGELFLRRDQSKQINQAYLATTELAEKDIRQLDTILEEYALATGRTVERTDFVRCVPHAIAHAEHRAA